MQQCRHTDRSRKKERLSLELKLVDDGFFLLGLCYCFSIDEVHGDRL